MGKEPIVVGVIIARGRSKGLPGKNLAMLGGRPLVAHTILAARRARTLDRVILSTDSDEIARVGRRFGAETPFLRPKQLAQDTTHTPPVIEHAVRFLEAHEDMEIDIVVTLQPTSPFRKAEHIDAAVRLLQTDRRLDSVISVEEAVFPPYWMLYARGHRLAPFVADKKDYSLYERQQLSRVYQPNGAVYATRRTLLKKRGIVMSAFAGGVTGYIIMDAMHSLDIDGPLDYELAKAVVKHRPELLR